MITKKPVIRVEFGEDSIEISRSGMQYESFGDQQIFRPRSFVEQALLGQEAQHFYTQVSPGRYTSSSDINAAIQHLCKFYGSLLETNLQKLASRDYIEFLLSEYNASFEIEMLARKGKLAQDAAARWQERGRVFRRATKYLLERVCALRPINQPAINDEELLQATETVQVCAEEFVQLCILSDSTYSIFPDETRLTVFPSGSPKLYLFEVLNERALQMGERVEIDGLNRSRVLEGRSIDRNVEAQNEYLVSFSQAHGIEYKDAINLLGHVVDSVPPSKGPFEVQFFHKADLLASFATQLGLPEIVLEKVFSGFLITADELNRDPAVIWNPKRSHRAYRRAIFEVPHADGICWAWCRGMAHEALETLIQGVVFQQFPEEWRTPEIELELAKLDNDRGKWFERTAEAALRAAGYEGMCSVKKLQAQGAAMHLPDDVGELDYVGFSPAQKHLILLEFKMTMWTSEPKLWRDDLHRFLNKGRGYAAKFRKKRDWILANVIPLTEALSTELKTSIKPESFSCAMITFWPNIASCFIDDFPCVSLAELIVDMENKAGYWPYEIGGSKI